MSRRSRPVETAVLLALPIAAFLVGPALSSIGVGEGNHDALLLSWLPTILPVAALVFVAVAVLRRTGKTALATTHCSTSLADHVDELAGRLVLENQLQVAVRHLLLLDHRLTVVLAAGAGDPRHPRAAPVLQLHRPPPTRVRRPVARIDARVDDIAVVEGLARRAALVERVEHVREHVDVTELGDLVADGEEPAGRRLSLLRHVLGATA